MSHEKRLNRQNDSASTCVCPQGQQQDNNSSGSDKADGGIADTGGRGEEAESRLQFFNVAADAHTSGTLPGDASALGP